MIKIKFEFSLGKKSLIIFSSIILALILSFGISLVLAWTDPTADPPSANVATPINTSSTAQTKTGNLTVAGWKLQDNRLDEDGEVVITTTDEWLRLNNSQHFTSGVFTPLVLRANGGFQINANQVIDAGAGWHRTYGNTGWYNETYGGGFYMIDTTWLRAYNNKHIYTGGKVKAGEFCIWNDCITSWPSGGGGGVAACSDCDSRFVNVTGDTITGSLTINNNLTANSNTWGACYWDSKGESETGYYQCENGYYIAGLFIHGPGSSIYDKGGVERWYCCKL